ncbi:hypothetical protein HCN44_002019 [Aphidius gifuensis]|uniref:Alpha-amylase n=2 Tax=Aphidius gifuensis TaxID=684658 RepID=A0A834Y2F3_APHGI|nr:hypothetical protein HCN44_002019 [Aphidius gifuensis]
MTLLVILLIGLCATNAFASSHKDPHFLPGHDTIVHLFEWKWSDIAQECESFLGPRGFGGIQISPVQENIIVSSRPWWERYQPISYKLTTRSGNKNDLRNMISRCNKAGVRIYVDAVVNHMSADQSTGKVIGTGGSTADPPSRNYSAVPYGKNDFNKFCSINNYDDPVMVRNCELVGLHDLNQKLENVRQKIVNFMNGLIDMGIAGFRIDAAKHMWPEDLKVIYSRLHDLSTTSGFAKDSKPFIYQEVIADSGIPATDYSGFATVTEFKYGNEISNAFLGNNQLKWLQTIGNNWGLLPNSDAVIFIDNHDTQRDNNVLNYKSSRLYTMAVAFMLAYPYGTPKIMSSFAFDNKDQGPPADSQGNILSPVMKNNKGCKGGWVCEHRWRQIQNMVGFRNAANKTSITEWWDNLNNQIAFSRGKNAFIAINGDKTDLKTTIHTQLPAGRYCDVISGSIKNNTCTGKIVVVNATGHAYIEILLTDKDGVLAIHKKAQLKN